MKRKLVSVRSVACLAAILSQVSLASASEFSVDFSAEENEELGWNVVNDGVMGGLSKGKVSFSDEGTLQFSGKLSLENNGGFSTVRTGRVDLDLGQNEGLRMRVKGDGRTYEVRVGTDARFRSMEISFMAEFATKKGEWTEVRVPFENFSGSFRGMDLPDVKFDASKIERLGFLIADKNEGAFDLEVDWVRAYGNGGKKGAPSKGKTIVDIALADGRFETLAAALTKAELVEVLQGDGQLTVFAPTDEAFAKLPKGTVENLLKPENKAKLQAVLKYHVTTGANLLGDALKAGTIATVQGENISVGFADGRVLVNKASLVNSDIVCSNGVIHVIDAVLLPPAPEPVRKTLVTVAKDSGSFGTLIAAVEAAGLTSVLEGKGPFTVFAPTDEAFAALPKGTVESLLKKENRATLVSILTYHVVPGKVSAGDALNAGEAKTVNGQKVAFAVKDGKLQVNNATILTVDVDGGNGVIHVIDTVLLPSENKGGKGKVESVSTTAESRIIAAIEKGVPLYNDGDKAGCVRVYQRCIESLVDDDQLDGKVRRMLAAVLEKGAGDHSDDDRAWLFRRSLDGTMIYLERAKH